MEQLLTIAVVEGSAPRTPGIVHRDLRPANIQSGSGSGCDDGWPIDEPYLTIGTMLGTVAYTIQLLLGKMPSPKIAEVLNKLEKFYGE